ncbi:MAG: transporter, family, fosmidomycin resistance protein [Rhodospirillaceae bacterium]|jgi:FSR family fosmidomycin resistance protein-like MFS transporter|nr:transporter, family, fosmidomycin resistance protein [Rhodospirillaceae bacterium]
MTADRKAVEGTLFAVLGAVSFSHLLNDMMQSLLPAIYPMLKGSFNLSFTQVGLITLIFQLTASLLQPAVGLYTDHRSTPFSLAIGMGSTLCGLLLLAVASSFVMLLLAAGLMGLGSSVFHPEASRVARLASGGRHGLAQSVFQVGGNLGSSLGPLLAAFIVVPRGQSSIAWFSLAAILAIAVLFNVGRWYRNHLADAKARPRARLSQPLPTLSRRKVGFSLAILVLLIFSKFFYMASLQSYYTFYLIDRFSVSVQSAQIHLFLFLAAAAIGTLVGGPLGDRFGRKYIIWFSILGVFPFTMMLPYAGLFWTGVLSVVIGLILSSAFSAILVFAQELVPGKVGTIAGLFFGFAFGMGGLGAALLGQLADQTSIEFVYRLCAYLPLIGLLTFFLPHIEGRRRGH